MKNAQQTSQDKGIWKDDSNSQHPPPPQNHTYHLSRSLIHSLHRHTKLTKKQQQRGLTNQYNMFPQSD